MRTKDLWCGSVCRPQFLGQITLAKLKPPLAGQGVVLPEPEARKTIPGKTLNITTEGAGKNANVQLHEVRRCFR